MPEVKGRDANHPVSEGIGHALRLLGCRAYTHRGLPAHEVNQLGGGMQPLGHRHCPDKVLERCSVWVSQGVSRAMSMIDTVTESFPMVVIFMPLADGVCVGL